MEENRIIDCTSEELGRTLYQLLFVEDNPEVEIIHPVDGPIIVTKESYEEMLTSLKKAMNMSPAQRIQETKRIARQKQIRFRTAMINADTRTVDIEDDENFGKDIEGKEIGIEDMIFLATKDYLKGVEFKVNEIGAFVDETMRRPPIRILTL